MFVEHISTCVHEHKVEAIQRVLAGDLADTEEEVKAKAEEEGDTAESERASAAIRDLTAASDDAESKVAQELIAFLFIYFYK